MYTACYSPWRVLRHGFEQLNTWSLEAPLLLIIQLGFYTPIKSYLYISPSVLSRRLCKAPLDHPRATFNSVVMFYLQQSYSCFPGCYHDAGYCLLFGVIFELFFMSVAVPQQRWPQHASVFSIYLVSLTLTVQYMQSPPTTPVVECSVPVQLAVPLVKPRALWSSHDVHLSTTNGLKRHRTCLLFHSTCAAFA